MRHRADIDGLRAVAVVPILFFHAGVPRTDSGFVGVDIFFVISGYLITSIITRDMAEGRFSLMEFYRRRMVRILPALFVMLAVATVVGILTLLPSELREFGASAAAAAGFVSNLFFFAEVNYFDGPAEFKPLLHTWSLGVEEQFYIVFPLLLLALRRWLKPWHLTVAVVLLLLASFGSNLLLADPAPAASFYLPTSRAWELLIGALVAIRPITGLGATGRNVAAALGLSAIAFAYVLISPTNIFQHPSLMLLPTAGTALILAVGSGTLSGRLLSIAPAAAIGRISYSLYLWHWPLIVFYRLNVEYDLSAASKALLIVASVVLAVLSRRFVELPFLAMRRAAAPRPLVLTGLAASVVMIAAGLAVSGNAGTLRAIPSDVRQVEAYADYLDTDEHRHQFGDPSCFATTTGPSFDPANCIRIAPGKRNVIVLGDSHAAQYWRAIAEGFPELNVMEAAASGCRPMLPAAGAKRCTVVVDEVFGRVIRTGAIDTLILAARWRLEDVKPLRTTIAAASSHVRRIVVIGPTVEYDGTVPLMLARSMLDGDEAPEPDDQELREAIDAAIEKATLEEGADYFSALDVECPADECILALDGVPMQFDYGHLTSTGARHVVSRLDLQLDESASPPGFKPSSASSAP